MEAAVSTCVAGIKACDKLPSGTKPSASGSACITAYTGCNAALMTPYSEANLNVYDMRKACSPAQKTATGGLCYDFSNVATYLGRADVRKTLGVPDKAQWSNCNHNVTLPFVFGGDWMHRSATIPILL